jgi:hypothetical protein
MEPPQAFAPKDLLPLPVKALQFLQTAWLTLTLTLLDIVAPQTLLVGPLLTVRLR